MGVIDEVKQRTDIIDVVGQYAKLTKSGKTFRALCPFHSEKRPSFFVYPEQQSWHCFGACSTGGDVFSFFMKKEGIDFGEALRQLAQRAGVTLPSKFEPKAESKEKQRLYQINEAAAQYYHDLLLNSPLGKAANKYVLKRGFTLQSTAEFMLGYSPNSWEELKKHLTEKGYSEDELVSAGLIIESDTGQSHDRFRNRLMFPIHDAKNHVIGFGARALDNSEPKYLNSPQTPLFDKSGSLYGINLAQAEIKKQNTAVIVEGYIDVITAHQNGFANVVAAMGTSVTDRQVGTLKKLTKNITLALDADAAGEEAMLRGVGFENSLGAEVKVIVLPEGKDPDDMIKEDPEAWQKLIGEALPVVDYTFNIVTANLDLTTAKDKSLAANELLKIIGEIKDLVRQAHYIGKLSRLINVSERTLEATLAKLKSAKTKYQWEEPKPETASKELRPVFASPVEEYCLALILKHPELKYQKITLSNEYFENSENREIFNSWQQSDKIEEIKEKLEPAIHGHFDILINRSLLSNNIEQKYTECALRLREKFLRGLAIKIETALAMEAKSGGSTDDLAKLEEQGIEVNVQLGEVFAQKSQMRLEHRG